MCKQVERNPETQPRVKKTRVKALEEGGIGRPSTYASIIQTIQDREYVQQIDRRFWATMLGSIVTDKLVQAFPEIMDVGFTCAYLATPYARRLSGATLYVDGGVNIMA